MSYFTYSDVISSLLDPKFVDLLIHVGAYGPKCLLVIKARIRKYENCVTDRISRTCFLSQNEII